MCSSEKTLPTCYVMHLASSGSCTSAPHDSNKTQTLAVADDVASSAKLAQHRISCHAWSITVRRHLISCLNR